MLEEKTYDKLLGHAFDIPVKVEYWDGTSEVYGEGTPETVIQLKKAISIKELTSLPTLTLGEAYMNGDIEVKGDLQELVASAYRSVNSFVTDNSGFLKFLPKISHSEKNSKEDVQSHYDIGNDFYRLWLDKTMTYSCAYFKDENDTLEQAQKNKVRHVLTKLNPERGKTLVDIGCGWGSVLFMAAEEFGLKATGITLSQEQYDQVKEEIKTRGLEGQVDVYLEDYREVEEKFDYATSIGMFEHVGKENLPKYFEQVQKLLVPNGRALIHGITGQHEGVGSDPFLSKYIFPGGYIPNVAENLTNIMNAGLQLTDLEPLRRHYQKTLEIWYQNYLEHIDTVVDRYGEPFSRMWSLYLQACAASFEAGNIDVMQYLLVNGTSGYGLPMTRDYMYENS
ncbi:cyclopropane-fatty-acyl-phospholipid synthase [Tetragenococcus halophilus]|uniref:SAM-dependent methyltransferase n=1 Tax=Tetragenococcus halophilus TaxID=51669 RepID=UPI00083D565C|nr:cyclopropane-fatty-acyl-phospholipid synthase family protein [Tetragenococcus halophilus]AOF48457.1 cyclopropane-fatty-acyl-phospholipid synthase [Tetragenococcus halophilus]